MQHAMIDSLVLGGLGGALYIYMSYCIYHILQNMAEERKTALTKFFIDPRAIKSFKILALSTAGTALLFGFRILFIGLGIDMKVSPFIMLLPIPFTGIAYFFHTIMKVTEETN